MQARHQPGGFVTIEEFTVDLEPALVQPGKMRLQVADNPADIASAVLPRQRQR